MFQVLWRILLGSEEIPQVINDFHSLPLANNDCAPVLLAALSQGFVAIQDDCAPIDSPLIAQTSADISQPMQQVAELYTATLPKDFVLVFSPYSPLGAVVLNWAGWERLQAFSVPQPLSESVDFTFAKNNLIAPVGQVQQVAFQQPASLTAWLHITNACNLDCPYCYIQKSSAKMSAATGYAVLDTVFQSALKNRLQSIHLKYAGGESALHFSLVKKLHVYAKKLAAYHNIKLNAVILSNGTYWTTEMAKWVNDYKITPVISLDGIGVMHDKLRPMANGTGSFSQIEHNIDHVLCATGVMPEISITVTGRNADAVTDIVSWALKRELLFSINFYRENSLSEDKSTLKLEESKIIDGMKEAYHTIAYDMPAQLAVNGLLDKTNLVAHTHTCGVGQNYLVFSHTGELAQCQMALDTTTHIDKFDDPLKIVEQGILPHLSVDEKDGCQTCMWRYRCTGGCPIETYRATGRFDVKSPHCNIYTALFPEVLRLEGLHILRINGYL